MTTIKLAVLRHTKSKDGSYKIRISIGHKSETHYIVTKYRVNSLANFVNGVVIGQPDAKAINIKLRQLLNEYDDKLERIPNSGELSCEQLRNILRDMPSSNNTATLMGVAHRYLEHLRKEGRASSANLMEYHLGKFLEFTHGDIFLAHLTPQMVDDYLHLLRSRRLSPSYITICMNPVLIITNYAIKMQLVKYEQHPFAFYKRQSSPPRDIDISVDDMRKLYRYQPTKRKTRKILDLFLLSYMLGGMNLKDLLAYQFTDKENIAYRRIKTKNTNHGHMTEFGIVSEAYPIIQRLTNDDGRIVMENKTYDSFKYCVNRSLKTIAVKAGLERTDISFYSARKSFVQHGFDLGIPLEILEYSIGQSMKTNRPIYNYAKIMKRHADDAIRKIVDLIVKD